ETRDVKARSKAKAKSRKKKKKRLLPVSSNLVTTLNPIGCLYKCQSKVIRPAKAKAKTQHSQKTQDIDSNEGIGKHASEE
ncbi:unnamed protein product, partial [Brassica oleracea var. botrytis]